MNSQVFWGLMIPLIGTSLGSALVFVMRDQINPKVQKVYQVLQQELWLRLVSGHF